MTPEEYSKWVISMDIYPHNTTDPSLALYALGLTGEAGEVAEKIKKMFRDGTVIDGKGLAKELGDVLWYLTRIGARFGYDLQDILDLNVAKLEDRERRGQRRGSGDDR